jgi:hypothetical protein
MAVGLTPWLALAGAAAKVTSAKGMADPAAKAAPMTKGKTDAVRNLFLFACMIRPPTPIIFDEFCIANVHQRMTDIRVTSPQTSVMKSGKPDASAILRR